MPASGAPLFQDVLANLNPFTDAKVVVANPDRGPLLIISGEKGTTIPPAISEAAFAHQRKNPAVTEIAEIPGRGHSLTIDSGWPDVARTALDFIRRHL